MCDVFTGVGPVFCQGVDLLYLANDRPEQRKEAAAELAAGKGQHETRRGHAGSKVATVSRRGHAGPR